MSVLLCCQLMLECLRFIHDSSRRNNWTLVSSGPIDLEAAHSSDRCAPQPNATDELARQ